MAESTGRPLEEGAAPGGDILSTDKFDAVIFDLDGVITDTAKAHFAAWKEVFDDFLRSRMGRRYRPFSEKDYRSYVDGKERLEGIESFLESRSLPLPVGEAEPPPPQQITETETMHSLARKKNRKYRQQLESGQVEAFDESIDLVKQLVGKGIKTALVSSSKNAKRVLEVLDLEALFDVRVDGKTLEEEGLKGKPAPDLFGRAAEMLDVDRKRAAVVEDAESGVKAAKNGGFGMVIGVSNNAGGQRSLLDAGADMVVEDLGALLTRH